MSMKEEEHQEHEEHHWPEEEAWYRGPLKYVAGIFLLLIIVLMSVPYYGIRMNPSPSYIPTIDEVVPSDIEIVKNNYSVADRRNFLLFVEPNDPVVKQTADSIALKACNSNERVCFAKAMFYFVRDNVDYVSDPRAYEYVKSARESLAVPGGDCDDSSVQLINLLEAVGIKTRFVFIPRHVYVEAWLPEAINRYKIDDDWVALDPTCDDCSFGELPYQNINKRRSYLEY